MVGASLIAMPIHCCSVKVPPKGRSENAEQPHVAGAVCAAVSKLPSPRPLQLMRVSDGGATKALSSFIGSALERPDLELIEPSPITRARSIALLFGGFAATVSFVILITEEDLGLVHYLLVGGFPHRRLVRNRLTTRWSGP
jgi:hypothetical protein